MLFVDTPLYAETYSDLIGLLQMLTSEPAYEWESPESYVFKLEAGGFEIRAGGELPCLVKTLWPQARINNHRDRSRELVGRVVWENAGYVLGVERCSPRDILRISPLLAMWMPDTSTLLKSLPQVYTHPRRDFLRLHAISSYTSWWTDIEEDKVYGSTMPHRFPPYGRAL